MTDGERGSTDWRPCALVEADVTDHAEDEAAKHEVLGEPPATVSSHQQVSAQPLVLTNKCPPNR